MSEKPGNTKTSRRLAAILAADIAGYSALIGADEEATVRDLKAHQAVILPLVGSYGGRVIDIAGDGILAEFVSVVNAVECAVAIQKTMADRNVAVPIAHRMQFRIGINIGDVIYDEQRVYGDGVNIAARLESIAEPGGICLSGEAFAHVHRKLPLNHTDLGDQQLKNIAQPIRVYRINAERPPIAIAQGSLIPTLTLPDKPSLAVLPFQNLSGDPDQDYFADGVVEEITTAIARLPWLFVIARNSSFTYKNKAVDVRQVGRELGVRYVLEGSIRRAGDHVRITGQLVDATTGGHIWADRFDGKLDNIFELQEQVASSVVGAIEPKLRSSEIDRVARKPTENLDAYDLYLRALAQVHKLTPDANQDAIRLSLTALEIDPTYAQAAALAAWCRAVQKWQGWIAPAGSDYAEGVRLAKQAIESGIDDPDLLWMAGHTLGYLAADHSTALTLIGRALVLNGNSAHAWGAKGLIESYSGQADRAIESFHRALRLNPLDPLGYHYKFGIAISHMSAGRYEEAFDWNEQALREQPKFAAGFRVKVALCGLLGRVEEGRESQKRLLELQPGLTVAGFAAHASTFLSKGLTESMVEGLRKAGLQE